jgi:hypothetical protein
VNSCGENLSAGAGRLKRRCGSFFRRAEAGDNFHAWIKSRNRAARRGCSKKITAQKMAVESGEKPFHGGRFSGWHCRC